MQRYVPYNANPDGNRDGDCTVRAICTALGRTWEEIYVALCVQGFVMRRMPESDSVWGAFLRSQGFVRRAIPNECPDCYTVRDFCEDHPEGAYLLAISGHVVYICDGQYFDSWDSGDEVPIYYWERSDNT